jgi:glycosyltransferase involved in cell wall biosynthesis
MDPPYSRTPLSRVVILGTHSPRLCGIATFTTDLAVAIAESDPDVQVGVVAMTDGEYDYPSSVFAQIPDSDPNAYKLAADAINGSDADVLCVQHEYGIFGGDHGAYLLELLRNVQKPIVTTLHTILRTPTSNQKEVFDEILSRSTRIVVMSHTARDLLSKVHGVDPAKVDYIPHGIPEITRNAGLSLRAEIGGDGPIILTFGLLSPDKGIENVIRALPQIAAIHPDVKYVVVGATHPHIKAAVGETYRQSLIQLATELEMLEHVQFIDEFVSIERLVEYLSATDFYITPYLNPMQITSGTLAYSMGAGKVVISTPYVYAEEVLANGRGILVPFQDPQAITDAVLRSCSNAEEHRAMTVRSRKFGSQMLWKRVGKLYCDSMRRATQDCTAKASVRTIESEVGPTGSEPSLTHLQTLTDDTGILQHATFSTVNRQEGYCIDDNSRALLFTVQCETRKGLNAGLAEMQSRYLSFVTDAFNKRTGRFRNFMSYQREWLEDVGSEDSQGRTMWALGETAMRSQCPERALLASKLFMSAIEPLRESRSPRTWAYIILGATAMLKKHPDEFAVKSLLECMANRLQGLFVANSSKRWMWIESRVAYANARVPQALIKAGHTLNDANMKAAGLSSLRWLLTRQTAGNGDFAPVGSAGAGPSDFGTIQFDQQPIEAASTVSACLTAYEETGQIQFLTEANRCFEWFLGRNVLGLPLANSRQGGCYDGLQQDGVNRNQGAESTLSYLSAFTELRTATDGLNSRRFLGVL